MNTMLVILVSIMVLCVGDVSAYSSNEMVLDAYMTSPEIIQAQREATKDGYEDGGIQIIGYGGLCGAVGCQSSYLVIQTLRYMGINRRSWSLMALVYVGPKGNVTSVKRVVLVDFEEQNEKN